MKSERRNQTFAQWKVWVVSVGARRGRAWIGVPLAWKIRFFPPTTTATAHSRSRLTRVRKKLVQEPEKLAHIATWLGRQTRKKNPPFGERRTNDRSRSSIYYSIPLDRIDLTFLSILNRRMWWIDIETINCVLCFCLC